MWTIELIPKRNTLTPKEIREKRFDSGAKHKKQMIKSALDEPSQVKPT